MTQTQTKTAHTPGELAYAGFSQEASGRGYYTVGTADGKRVVCSVEPGSEAGANAARLCLCWNEHDRLVEQRDDLLAALENAKVVIGALHGPVAWEIYDEHSPEMKEINAAIAKAQLI